MTYSRYYCIFLAVLLFIPAVAVAQPLSVGAFTGINLSDIHGADLTGKWKFKPGPSAGVYADYSFWNIFGIRTGFRYSAVYYEHKLYDRYFPSPWEYYPGYSSTRYPASSSYFDPTRMMYYPRQEKMDFSFLTIPLQLRITVPSKPQLDISGGIFYSFVQGGYSDPYLSVNTEPEDRDFGYIWSAALSYPLPGDFKVSLATSYYTGRRQLTEYSSLRHGYIDFTMGLSYSGFLKKSAVNDLSLPGNDSIPSILSLTYFGGVNINGNSCEYNPERYSISTGPSAGFRMNVRWARKSSFQTGLSFERKGYALKDSSSVYYRYVEEGSPIYMTDTKTSIDYIVIPALLNFYIGERDRYYLNTGFYAAFKLNARVTGKAYDEYRSGSVYRSTLTTVYDDIDSAIKGMDAGWQAGGGLLIPIKAGYSVDIGLRYSIGFVDILDRSYFGNESEIDTYSSVMKNSSLSVHAGISLPAGRRHGL